MLPVLLLLLVQSQRRTRDERERTGGEKQGGKERESVCVVERQRDRMREPRRAEERKSIPIQSESDKPEQCIVQTHSITQSHTHTWKHSHRHERACAHTHALLLECACLPS